MIESKFSCKVRDKINENANIVMLNEWTKQHNANGSCIRNFDVESTISTLMHNIVMKLAQLSKGKLIAPEELNLLRLPN